MPDYTIQRRHLVLQSGLPVSAVTCHGLGLPRARAAAATVSDSARPKLEQGIQIGDVLGNRAIVWSRADRPSRLIVEWDTTPRSAAINSSARRTSSPTP